MKRLAVGLALVALAFAFSSPGASAGGFQLPLISVSPSSVDFGNVPVYAVASADIVVTNDSADAPLTVTAVKTKSPFSEGVRSFTLQPGQSKTITIAFAPTAPIQYNSVCTILSNASNQPNLSVSLTGWGVE